MHNKTKEALDEIIHHVNGELSAISSCHSPEHLMEIFQKHNIHLIVEPTFSSAPIPAKYKVVDAEYIAESDFPIAYHGANA